MGRKAKTLKREKTHWSVKPLYVIASEGAVTEKIYFNGIFRQKNIRMPILATKSGDSSPEKVIKRLNKYRNEYNASADEMWLVIDKDHWHLNILKRIAQECKTKGYNLIISNPCFELWLLLHQEKPKQPLTNSECEKELKKLIPNYKKAKYDPLEIKDSVNLALAHAKKLDNGEDIQDPPNTKVYRLVEKLIEESDQ